MRHFPVFLDLAGRQVLVVGDTAQAAQRHALAVAAGAHVTRIATLEEAELVRGTSLTFVSTGSADDDRLAAGMARRAGVPVNVVDRADLSDFIVPAIVDRGDIVVGISSGGVSPILARSIRERIESILPPRLSALAAFAGRFRAQVRSLLADVGARRRFWSNVIGGAIGARVLAGDEAGAARLMMAELSHRSSGVPAHGALFIVGAGPGDPELLTLRALRILQDADVILHDDLVDAAILGYARREATRIPVGKRKGMPSHSQSEINSLMVAAVRAGKKVVRLKGGDPFVFGRGGEEVEYAAHHGIEAIVVPGITAALGCAAAAGIPLTDRRHASAVTLVTGHGADGVAEPDWHALARSRQTLAIYMGLTNAAGLRASLISAGLPATTPVAIVQDGTLPTQRVARGSLDTLPVMAACMQNGRPALLIVGDVARQAADAFSHLKEVA